MSNTTHTGIVSFDTAGDHALVLAVNRGENQAFEILVKRYRPKIFAIALRFARVREDAEDVVQETFHKAFIRLHRFDGKSSFFTWLTRIATNEALMLLRKERALREVPMEGSAEDETVTRRLEMTDPLPDPEADYLRREATEILRSAIGKLTARLRTTVELRELGELSSRETARRMGVSVAAVKASVFDGRRKLRKTLRRLGIAPKRVRRTAVAMAA